MNFIRYLASAFAVFMAFMVLTATPGTAHAANCGYTITQGRTVLVDSGCRIVGDVVVDGIRQYDDNPATGLVVDCAAKNGCSVYAPFGAGVSGQISSDLYSNLMSTGCGMPNGCYAGVFIQNWYGTQSGYGQYNPNPPVVPIQPPVAYPPVVYPPGSVIFPASNNSSSWGNSSITIGAAGANSWIVLNGSPGQIFQNCWFPSTPSGGGSANNAVPNLVTVSNPPPTNLPFCGPVFINGSWWEIRTMDWYPGTWIKAQGIAIATNDGKRCNSGNCTTDQATMTSTGGRIWFLAPYGSAQDSVTPFTPATTVNQGPTTVFPGTAETITR